MTTDPTYQISVPWSTLSNSLNGIDDGLATYRIGVRAANETVDGDLFTTTEYIDLTVNNVDPTVSVTESDLYLGSLTYVIDFAATDPGDDTPINWLVDWGDGTDEEDFGSGTNSASHNYNEPGPYTISVRVIDEDAAVDFSDPDYLDDLPDNLPTGTLNAVVQVGGVSPGGPYEINEGDSLTLSPSFILATPDAIEWDLNDDGDFTDASWRNADVNVG